MAFDLAELVERAWLRISAEQSEAEKKLYRDELVYLVDDAFLRLAVQVANNPAVRHRLQTVFTIPAVGTTGACSLVDDAPSKDPALPIITSHVYQVDIQTGVADPAGATFYPGVRLAQPDDLYRAQPPGYFWWTVRDDTVETIAPDGTTRYTPGGIAMFAGATFQIRANYVPGFGNLSNRAELQEQLVDNLVALALAKTNPKLAAQMAIDGNRP